MKYENLKTLKTSRWPVSKFTAKRTPKVIGRIKFLIISIMFKKNTEKRGIPTIVK